MIEKYFVKQGLKKIELDDYLAIELGRAGFTKSEIVKTPLVTRIVVNVTRPGLAIGKSGSNIMQLTQTISERFGIDNPQLEIREIQNQAIDAQAVANKLKALIERGFSWRSIVFKIVNEIRESKAQGLEIILSGKIAGKAGRKRRQRIAFGYMKKVGEQAKLVDYGAAAAYPKVGAIGIKVKIVKPDTMFPDKAQIKEYIKRREEAPKPAEVKEEIAETIVEKPVEAVEKAAEVAEETPEKKVEHKPEKKTEHKEKPKHVQPKADAVPPIASGEEKKEASAEGDE